MRRRGSASIAANPVLIGAATTLVVIVAVFLAYNANNGLPFVPSYALKADVPSAAQLVKGNEVRLGGTRVGVVDKITPVRHADGSVTAELSMKLETTIKPLPIDSTVIVRPRSALGLKYVELTRGTSSEGLGGRQHDPAPPGDAQARRDRRSAEHVRRQDARRLARQPDRVRQRPRRPRAGPQHRDRGPQPAPDRPRPGDAQPVGPAHEAAAAVPRAGADGVAGGAGRRDAGLAVRQPRHDLPGALERGAAVHPGFDRRAARRRSTRRRARSRSSARSCATASSSSTSCARASGRCAPRPRRSPTRSRPVRGRSSAPRR